jgi:predicted permease
MGVPLVDGRDFTEQDDMQAPRAVVINEAMARRFWQGQNPLGRKLRTRDNREARVIGVVRTGKYRFLNEPPTPFMYLCYQQGVWDMNLGVVIRAEREPQQLAGLLRREIQALNPGVEVWALLPAHDYVEAAFLPQRIAATLLLILGVVAVLLAAMGIYGIMAYVVSHRTHEIGVRMALGAGVADILKLIIAQSLRMVLAGVALGLAGASALTRLLSSFLYGVSPFDLATFTGVSTILAAVALFASYLPARRATRVDPGVALRYE